MSEDSTTGPRRSARTGAAWSVPAIAIGDAAVGAAKSGEALEGTHDGGSASSPVDPTDDGGND